MTPAITVCWFPGQWIRGRWGPPFGKSDFAEPFWKSFSQCPPWGSWAPPTATTDRFREWKRRLQKCPSRSQRFNARGVSQAVVVVLDKNSAKIHGTQLSSDSSAVVALRQDSAGRNAFPFYHLVLFSSTIAAFLEGFPPVTSSRRWLCRRDRHYVERPGALTGLSVARAGCFFAITGHSRPWESAGISIPVRADNPQLQNPASASNFVHIDKA